MAYFPFQYTNIRGIPTIKAQSVVVSDTSVDYKFNPDWNARPFRGLLLVYLAEAIPEGTTGTLPVRLSMAGTTSNVTLPGGANVTAADLPGTGVYLVYYDRFSDVLQVLSILPPATA